MSTVNFGGIRIRHLLTTLVVLIVADGVISNFLIRHGLAQEGNPFLQTLVGKESFLVIKVLGALRAHLSYGIYINVGPGWHW